MSHKNVPQLVPLLSHQCPPQRTWQQGRAGGKEEWSKTTHSSQSYCEIWEQALFLPPSDIIQVWHLCLLNVALPESQFLCLTKSQSSKTRFRNLNHAGFLVCFIF